jgi:hypothetical protein
VPSPEPRGDALVSTGPALERGILMAGSGAAPAGLRPSRPWTADDAALATGGQALGGGRTAAPAPRLPRSAPAGGPASPPYGDWTKPRSGDTGRTLGGPALEDDYVSGPVGLRVAAAPSTTMIPERTVAGRGESADAYDDGYDENYDEDYDDAPLESRAPAPVRGPATGPAVGGRAAKRAERQAAELARQKAAKRNGVPAVAALDEVDAPDRKPRRVAKGLVAMVVVACGVLGAYSYVSPHTKDAATQKPAVASTDPVVAPDTSTLPPLATTPVVAPPAVVAPVRVPVTVLNATSINGLAAKVETAIGAKGWTSPGVGAYKGGDVAASTVFFTQGDEKQRQAAVQLVDQFPQLTGPAPRFFQLPAGVSAPGLVVVVTGDWKP